MAKFTVMIELTDETTVDLLSNGYSLVAMRAVQTAAQDMLPTMWYLNSQFDSSISLSWDDGAAAGFIASEPAVPGAVIPILAMYSMAPGSTLQVTSEFGGDVVGTGTPGVFAIASLTNDAVAGGFAQSAGGQPAPLCFTPVWLGATIEMTLSDAVLLAFVPDPIAPGTVTTALPTSSLLVSMAGAPDNSRVVTFSMDGGWSADGATWAVSYPENQDLIAVLIQPD